MVRYANGMESLDLIDVCLFVLFVCFFVLYFCMFVCLSVCLYGCELVYFLINL
jgi:hypothetical protein